MYINLGGSTEPANETELQQKKRQKEREREREEKVIMDIQTHKPEVFQYTN